MTFHLNYILYHLRSRSYIFSFHNFKSHNNCQIHIFFYKWTHDKHFTPIKFVCVRIQLYVTLCDSMDCSPPGSSVHGISRQEYWSELSFPSPGDLPNPVIQAGSTILQTDSLPLSHRGAIKFDQLLNTNDECCF